MYDVIIVGAGVIGCLTARNLAKYNLKILVIEKDNDVGNETTSANSAIVHSGYDPLPNSSKAKFNVLGNAMFDKLCEELDVKFKRIGSITVAFDERQMETLKELQERATLNNVKTELLDKTKVHELEPMLSEEIVGGLLAPTAGIVDPFNLAVHAMENAIDNGVELKLSTKVESIKKVDDHFVVNDEYEAKVVINCAGIYSDVINKMVNKDDTSFEILPRKGEYFVLDHFNRPFVNHTIFMVPSEKGKGVLISPTTSQNYLIGPSAELTSRDDNATDKLTLSDVRRQASSVIPNIPFYEVIRTFAGIRSTPSTHDFIIEESKTKGFINVAGIESPGLASSPAIADYVVNEIVGKIIKLEPDTSFNPCVKKYIKHPGKMICKCERVSLQDVMDVLNRSCPPHSIKGMKRRVRAGFGRCQGGMCQGDVLKIMADFYGVDRMDIPYDNDDSFILVSKTKEEN